MMEMKKGAFPTRTEEQTGTSDFREMKSFRKEKV